MSWLHGRQRDLHMTSKDTGATGGRRLDELHVLGAAAVTPLGLRRAAYAVLVGRGLARRIVALLRGRRVTSPTTGNGRPAANPTMARLAARPISFS